MVCEDVVGMQHKDRIILLGRLTITIFRSLFGPHTGLCQLDKGVILNQVKFKLRSLRYSISREQLNCTASMKLNTVKQLWAKYAPH